MLQIHYTRVSFARSVFFFAIGLALVAFIACTNDGGGDDNKSSSSSDGGSSPGGVSSSGGGSSPSGVSSSSGGSSPGGISSSGGGSSPSGVSSSSGGNSGGLDLENVIEIKYNNGSAPTITKPDDVQIQVTGENVVVTTPNDPDFKESKYNFVLSGATSNGSLRIYGDVRKGLYLNGVNITNNSGSAINIQKSGRIIVHLVNGTQNFLTDGSSYKCNNFAETEEQAKGAFFSEGKLSFEGSGSLEVKGKCNHAIVADNDFEVSNGKIIVREAAGDGIHANDKIEIRGGVLEISSTGDAIQSEYDFVKITGGKITAKTTGTKSHGIASEGEFVMDPKTTTDVIVQISVLGNGSKGIRSRNHVKFYGGKTSIEVSGTKHPNPTPTDPTDESNPAGIKSTFDIYIEGGELTIKSPGSGAKGISVDRNATISAGNVDIDADDDGIKVKGDLEIKGGTIKIKSAKKKAIDVIGEYSKTGGLVTILDGN